MKPLFAPFAALTIAACATGPGAAPMPELANLAAPEPGVYSAGRVAPDDIARLRAAGIEHVVDLTTPGESPDFDEGAAARAAGLAYSNLPLDGAAGLTPENVQAFDALLRAADGPVLVHCASGNRVGAMAALRAAWIDGRDADEAIAIGRQWGLKGLEEEVRRRIDDVPANAAE